MTLHDGKTMARPHEVLLGSDRFQYAGKEYFYLQVTSLEFYAVETTHKVNFVETGKTYNTQLDIYVEGLDRPIKIRPGGPIAEILKSGYSREHADSVSQLYVPLAEKTFQYRLQRYLKMIEQYGCFVYDGKRFYPDGSVTDGERQVNLRTSTEVYKQPFRLFVRLHKSLGQKLIHRFMKDQDFGIDTRRDADIFFSLLAQLYGLRWGT